MPYVALITGASSGIGEAAAQRLAREPDLHLVLVARREERLRALADELERTSGTNSTIIPTDLTEADAPATIAAAVERDHGALHLLVNNAGASWRGSFADTGWANVERHMRINFDAQVRLTEALLPCLRRTAADLATNHAANHAANHATDPPSRTRLRGLRAPVSIVNVISTASRFARPRAGAYSASKFALAGWTDALHIEELSQGVHVGIVNPGFIATEGFPASELRRHVLLRHIVSTPDRVAEAILDAGPGGKAERFVPRYYWVAGAARILAPSLVRRVVAGGVFTTTTNSR
jgi:short-subunit dehydrogenase